MDPGPDALRLESLGPRLRAAADGEAPGIDLSREPDDALRIEFEKGLREAVGRVMSVSPAAPAALRERILADLAEADAPAPLRFPRWLWWAPAVAAVLAAAVGTALMVGRSSGPATPTGAPVVAGTTVESEPTIGGQQVTRLVSFAERAHNECALFGDTFNRKMVARTEAEGAAAAIELLKKVPDVLEIRCGALAEAGYEFAGLGRCQVPGEGRSAHLIYRCKSGAAPSVSLFIQEDLGDMPLECDRFYCCRKAEAGGKSLTIWRQDGLIYYLFAPCKEEGERARVAFGAPGERGTI